MREATRFLTVSLIVGCLFVNPLSLRASSWEWFSSSGAYVKNRDTGSSYWHPQTVQVEPGWQNFVVYYEVDTSSAYTENINVYLKYASSTPGEPAYIEVNSGSCQVHTTVDTQYQGSCWFNAPLVAPPSAGSGTLTEIRVTTNYEGCGSYTPTPTASCGDVQAYPVEIVL